MQPLLTLRPYHQLILQPSGAVVAAPGGQCPDCGAGIIWLNLVVELESALLWLCALSIQVGCGLPEP